MGYNNTKFEFYKIRTIKLEKPCYKISIKHKLQQIVLNNAVNLYNDSLRFNYNLKYVENVEME